jgi:hypothetical protein
MDYVTRQFINLTKKFRKELRKYQQTLHVDLARLSNGLKDLKNSAEAHQQTNTKSSETQPLVTITELRTQVPISVQAYTEHTKKGSRWRKAKGVLEVAVGIAVIVYSVISYQIWQEQIDATNFGARQAESARKGLNETTKNFRLDQRPWVGVVSIDGNVPSPADEPITIKIKVINSGKTPSFDTHAAWESACNPLGKTVKPTYTERIAKGHATLMPGQDMWLENEDKAICTPENTLLFKKGKATIYVMGTIWYKDEFHQLHRTDFCAYSGFDNGELEILQAPPQFPPKTATGHFNFCSYHNNAT